MRKHATARARWAIVAALVAGAWFVPTDRGLADEAPGDEIIVEFIPDFRRDDGRDLRAEVDASTRRLLTPVQGRGFRFGPSQKKRYCRLKADPEQVQWVLTDLESGEVLSRSPGAERLFFGASASKIFVAAALLDKQKGELRPEQLRLLVRMIVVSDNGAWLSLQRQTAAEGTDDAGRAAVHGFVQKMGYPTIRGFQGWMRRPGGSRTHGNELNAVEVARFLQDTYARRYDGADTLWKIMHATKTGGSKIDKYTPSNVYIGGKTGTYSGPNESPETVELPTIRARNHAAVVTVGNRHYGVVILTNTGDNEDVAVLGGGLMREFLGVKPAVSCP